MRHSNTYPGFDQDENGGMTQIGNIVKHAWIFELIPEDEMCRGWSYAQLEALAQQVEAKWHEYGFLVNQLPEALRARHQRIHREAIERARAAGWDPNLDNET